MSSPNMHCLRCCQGLDALPSLDSNQQNKMTTGGSGLDRFRLSAIWEFYMSKPLNKHGIKFSVEIIGFGEEDTYFQVHDPLFFDETYLQATMFWYIAHMFKSIGMHFDVPCYFGPIIDELNQRFEREYELKQDSKNG